MLEPVVVHNATLQTPTTSPTPCSVALWIWVVRHRERTRPKTEALNFFLFPWECSSPRTCQSGNPLCHALCLTPGIMAVARLYAFPRVAALLRKVTGAMLHRGWRGLLQNVIERRVPGGFRIVLNSAGYFRGHLLFLPVVFFPWRMVFFVPGFGFLFFQRSSFQQCNHPAAISCISAGGKLIRYSSYLRKQEVTEEEKAERRCPWRLMQPSVSWLYGIHFGTLDVIIPMNSWLDLGVISVSLGSLLGIMVLWVIQIRDDAAVQEHHLTWKSSTHQHTWRKWWGRLITARAKPWFFGIQVRYSIVFQLLTVDM